MTINTKTTLERFLSTQIHNPKTPKLLKDSFEDDEDDDENDEEDEDFEDETPSARRRNKNQKVEKKSKREEKAPEPQVDRFVLSSIIKGSSNLSEIYYWEVPKDLSQFNIEEVVDEIIQYSYQDAETKSRTQKYVVEAEFTDDREPPRSPSFVIKPDNADDGKDLGHDIDEESSLHGLVHQQMRHNESLFRTMTSGHSTTISLMARTIEGLTRRNDTLENDRMKTMLLMENLISESHKRELEVKRENKAEERKDLAIDKIVALLPLIGMKMLGPGGMPALPNSDPRVIAVHELITSLNENELQSIAEKLGPEKQVLFENIIKAYIDIPLTPGGNGNAH